MHSLVYGVLLFILVISTGDIMPPDRTMMHIALDQVREPTHGAQRLDRSLDTNHTDKACEPIQPPPDYFLVEDGLIKTLQQNAVTQTSQQTKLTAPSTTKCNQRLWIEPATPLKVSTTHP